MILHWYEHHLNRRISLLNISPTYEVQTFISYTCLQGGGGGRTLHTHPYPHIDQVPAPMSFRNFWINVIKILSSYICLKQERIQEFQSQGLEFFGCGNCFDAPSRIPNVSNLLNELARGRCAGPGSAFVKLEISYFLRMIYGLRRVHLKIFINQQCSWTHARTYKMCAIDIQ